MEGLSGIWLLFTYLVNYTGIGQYLPVSPVQRWLTNWNGITVIQNYLKYVNWFIPVSVLIDIMSGWLVAIGIFYGIQAILRWIKVIGD